MVALGLLAVVLRPPVLAFPLEPELLLLPPQAASASIAHSANGMPIDPILVSLLPMCRGPRLISPSFSAV
jgi:hypothetical protein